MSASTDQPKTLEEQLDESGGVEDISEEPVLELSTLAPKRPRVRLISKEFPDGKLYELAVMNDFGIEEQQKLRAQGAEFDQLWEGGNLSANDSNRLKMLLDEMFDKVLLAPKKVKSELKDGHRANIVMAFTLAPLAMATARQRMLEETREESQTTEN